MLFKNFSLHTGFEPVLPRGFVGGIDHHLNAKAGNYAKPNPTTNELRLMVKGTRNPVRRENHERPPCETAVPVRLVERIAPACKFRFKGQHAKNRRQRNNVWPTTSKIKFSCRSQ